MLMTMKDPNILAPQQPEQGMTGIETPTTTDNMQGAEQ